MTDRPGTVNAAAGGLMTKSALLSIGAGAVKLTLAREFVKRQNGAADSRRRSAGNFMISSRARRHRRISARGNTFPGSSYSRRK